jgi:nitronate monooxygenase
MKARRLAAAEEFGRCGHELAPSFRRCGGHDPQALTRGQIDFPRQDQKRWRDLWSAGQGAGIVDRVRPLAKVVERLCMEYRAAQVA